MDVLLTYHMRATKLAKDMVAKRATTREIMAMIENRDVLERTTWTEKLKTSELELGETIKS